MTKEIEKKYALWRKVTPWMDEKDIVTVEHEWDKYQIIQICEDLGQAVQTIVWCSQCELLELIIEKEIRIMNIIKSK